MRRLLSLPLLATLWMPAPLAAQAEGSLVLSEEAKENLGIELATAERRDLHDILEVRGMLREQADRVAWVTPTAKGQIMDVFFKTPDRVRKGDVLLTLYCPRLEELRSELAQGLEMLELLQGELTRVGSLVDRGILSERDRLRVAGEHARVRAATRAARRSILLLGMTEAELQTLLDAEDKPAYLPVHAPIGGYVTFREAYRGEMVEPGRRLFRLMDISVLWAEGDVFERDVPGVKVGQQASLVLRPFKEWRSEGTIKSISADLRPSKRTAHIWIEVKNSDGRLKPQMAVDISILLDKKEQTLAVPKLAVLEDQGESFVFVANGEAFVRQRVVVGRRDHVSCEVLEGLYEGDQVVTRGSHELQLAITTRGDGPAHAH